MLNNRQRVKTAVFNNNKIEMTANKGIYKSAIESSVS